MTSEVSRSRLPEWIRRPEMLVALSAVVLSLCGLFIAIYESLLIRQQQRASVWPHMEVLASLGSGEVKLWVANTGIGPSRVEAAAVTVDGETVESWREMLRSVGDGSEDANVYYSLVSGRVLPPASDEKIFSLGARTGEGDGASDSLIAKTSRAILEGTVDVSVCYCSVYDECWTSRLQDIIGRSQGLRTFDGPREVADCAEAPRSGI